MISSINKYYKKVILLFAIISYPIICTNAQANRALLIGISEYSNKYSWTHIHGKNDINLVKGVLKNFEIKELCDSKATYSNIIKELNRLSKETKENDIVYIHLSGHGQPIEDRNGDEEDGWDESFVPYDAGQFYGEKGYNGSKHLIDDELGIYLTKIRKKAGKKGMVYVIVDACHSGTMSRDDDETIPDSDDSPIRGSNVGFSENKKYKPTIVKKNDLIKLPSNKDMADIIVFEACGEMQRNQEIKKDGISYGVLTYSIANIVRKLGWGKSYKWIEMVRQEMSRNIPSWSRQKMVVETSIDL